MRSIVLSITLAAIWTTTGTTDPEMVDMVNNAKLVASIVLTVKTALLFGLASVLSNRLASIWPDHGEWFKKGAVAVTVAPWVWWAAAPALRAFGFHSTDKH